MTLEDLQVQRERADKAYRHIAWYTPTMPDYDQALKSFQVETDRLIALELRWLNREARP